MQYIESGTRPYRHALISMLLGSIVTFAVMYSPQPLISLFSEEYHVTPATASFSISLTTISLAFSLLFISEISNGWNRKTIMSISLLSTSILAILSTFGNNFYVFLAIRFLEGISISGFPSIAMAYLNEEFNPGNMGRVIGVYVAGTAIGGFVGRIVVGALTDLFTWHIALVIIGVMSLLFSLWFWIYLPQSNHFTPQKISFEHLASNMKEGFHNKKLLYVYILGFLFMGVYVTLLNYIGFPLTSAPYNLSQTVFGFLFVVNLVGTWSSIWFGGLADQHSRQHVLWLAISILLIGALLTLHGSLVIKIIGITIFAFGFFGGHTVASGWIGVLATKNQKAQASSFYLLFYYTGSSLVGWSGGLFIHQYGWGGVISFISALLILAVWVSAQTTNTVRPSQTH